MNVDRSSLVRQFSRRMVAEALLHDAPISRANLARMTGLSKQTMSEVIAELEAGGWVRSVGVTKGGVGRTAVTYEVDRGAAHSLGVDLGGTKVTAAITDLVGEIVAEETEPTDSRGGRQVVVQIRKLAAKLAASQSIDMARIRSVVVGTPGVIDRATGAITLVPNIKGLSEFDVPRALADLFGQTVVIENDVNLAMLGEAWRGCARGAGNAGFLALGTGVGLGLIVDGKLIRGATGAAGEIAYLPIGADVVSPEALAVGAFELEVGSVGIVRRYRTAGGQPVETVRDVFARLDAGDAVAARVLDDTANTVALAIAALHTIVDPQIVVLGGSVGIRPELVERVQRAMPTIFARPVKVVASDLGSRAGLVGAVSLAVNRLHNDLFGVRDLPGDLALPETGLAKAAE
ncbi:Sugar kinase of the NBD/HSP70 family, may contain an N-terminal HTH domain [Rhizobiales bacterium GAS188]|nr:Sugar kinase of the NBD/HSP70 family, may contain an N-terminal HTH domain [Rhizobiales bacterium GAS188]